MTSLVITASGQVMRDPDGREPLGTNGINRGERLNFEKIPGGDLRGAVRSTDRYN
jgi:hypothetical protein